MYQIPNDITIVSIGIKIIPNDIKNVPTYLKMAALTNRLQIR